MYEWATLLFNAYTPKTETTRTERFADNDDRDDERLTDAEHANLLLRSGKSMKLFDYLKWTVQTNTFRNRDDLVSGMIRSKNGTFL